MDSYDLAGHVAGLLDGTVGPEDGGFITAWVEQDRVVVEYYSDDDVFQEKFILTITVPETA